VGGTQLDMVSTVCADAAGAPPMSASAAASRANGRRACMVSPVRVEAGKKCIVPRSPVTQCLPASTAPLAGPRPGRPSR